MRNTAGLVDMSFMSKFMVQVGCSILFSVAFLDTIQYNISTRKISISPLEMMSQHLQADAIEYNSSTGTRQIYVSPWENDVTLSTS